MNNLEHNLWIYISFMLLLFSPSLGVENVIYAVNCGGEAHTDINGIRFEKDPLHGKVGIASDYGKRLFIGRVPTEDQILYQTERYHTNTFGYDIPLDGDGDYLLVLKFCEVYFTSPNQKVFDVVLNGDHIVVMDLDIFEKVGRGVAHDEYIPFKVSNGRLFVNDEDSDIRGGKIRVEFIKSYKDNPKINAILVVKGKVANVPVLPPFEPEPTEKVKEEVEYVPKNRKPSGPKQPDPYPDGPLMMLPFVIAIGAFIPLLYCLCKL